MSVGSPESPVFRRRAYRGWDAVWAEHGDLALVLVPQVGGRITGLRYDDEDITFVNGDLAGRADDVAAIEDVRAAKRERGFVLWGGDKTWLAPQHEWTEEVPFIDLDSGAYELSIDEDRTTATMASPVCRETGVQIERALTLGIRPGTWRVSHTLRNRGAAVVAWAPWIVAMILRPATVFLPTRAASRYSRGVRTFANEGDSTRVRDRVLSFSDDIAMFSCREPLKFKYGSDANSGWVLAVIETGQGRLLGFRKSIPTFHPQRYGHGCVAEVFNSSDFDYFEMELHGPVVTLRPGESFTLVEHAALFDVDAVPLDAPSVRQCLGQCVDSRASL